MSSNQTHGSFVIAGGAIDMDRDCLILRKFVELAGGRSARIVVMTVATARPREAREEYTQAFKRLDADRVRVIDTAKREDANDSRALDDVKDATGVFFTGGDQDRIYKLIKDTEIDALLHQRYNEPDFVIGGTSAGAHAMSNMMIVEGSSNGNPRYGISKLDPGLGFLQGVIIDSHFDQRGRLGRLLSALALQPHMWGLGLDENTAVVVKDNQFIVIGENAVNIVDVSQTSHINLQRLRRGEGLALWGVKLDILPHGYGFDIENQMPILEENLLKRELIKI